MRQINLKVANKNYNADWYYKSTKGLFGFAASAIKKTIDGKYILKTSREHLTEEEREEKEWNLWDGSRHQLSCAALLISNEFNLPLALMLTPGMSLFQISFTSFSAPFQVCFCMDHRRFIEEESRGSRSFCSGNGHRLD